MSNGDTPSEGSPRPTTDERQRQLEIRLSRQVERSPVEQQANDVLLGTLPYACVAELVSAVPANYTDSFTHSQYEQHVYITPYGEIQILRLTPGAPVVLFEAVQDRLRITVYPADLYGEHRSPFTNSRCAVPTQYASSSQRVEITAQNLTEPPQPFQPQFLTADDFEDVAIIFEEYAAQNQLS